MVHDSWFLWFLLFRWLSCCLCAATYGPYGSYRSYGSYGPLWFLLMVHMIRVLLLIPTFHMDPKFLRPTEHELTHLTNVWGSHIHPTRPNTLKARAVACILRSKGIRDQRHPKLRVFAAAEVVIIVAALTIAIVIAAGVVCVAAFVVDLVVIMAVFSVFVVAAGIGTGIAGILEATKKCVFTSWNQHSGLKCF